MIVAAGVVVGFGKLPVQFLEVFGKGNCLQHFHAGLGLSHLVVNANVFVHLQGPVR